MWMIKVIGGIILGIFLILLQLVIVVIESGEECIFLCDILGGDWLQVVLGELV